LSPPAEDTVVTYYTQHEDNYTRAKVKSIAGITKEEKKDAIRRIERNHKIIRATRAEEVYRLQAEITRDPLDRLTAKRLRKDLKRLGKVR